MSYRANQKEGKKLLNLMGGGVGVVSKNEGGKPEAPRLTLIKTS